MTAFFDQPILNSPYVEPGRHWELDREGLPTDRILPRRRLSELLTPIPKPKKQGARGEQQSFVLDTGHGFSTEEQEYNPTPTINFLREEVARWRAEPDPGKWRVTPVTATLLQHWRALQVDPTLAIRPFFCQVEAVETAIWLHEVAPKLAAGRRFLDWLAETNAGANPDLFRIALKLATGAGKTTVMAMLIAWQAINATRSPNSRTFSRAFLVITPGITIRDRLRVLMPNDRAYYHDRGLVPGDMLADLGRAKVVITNYHAFQLRETMQLATGTRAALKGHGPEIATKETAGEMLRRAIADLMGMKNVVVLNDEAHHCYRERPQTEAEKLTGDERKEAEENKEAARLWISGIEAVKKHLGLGAVYDLSATPFFLSGSGWPEGMLFPWTVSDFSLMDAIECGIVKLPRVPVADNLPGQPQPLYRNLWPAIRQKMPKKTRGEKKLDPQKLPTELKTALDALYGNYTRTFEAWEKAGIATPPVFIVVCNNTTNSELVAEYIAGYERERTEGETDFHQGALELFRNFTDDGDRLHRPRTLLIDSQQIDSGEAIPPAFLDVYRDEIDTFRREKAHRDGESAKAITPEEILREVMNTIGRRGRLGAEIRCVVSVAMLTEGWDANTVTHILGLRAFGTRLISEQVIGRALRRLSYDTDPETGLFPVEYADIMGIDGLNFAAQAVPPKPQLPRETIHVHAVPGREALEITFPRVEGYRIELPDERLTADFSKLEPYVLDPAKVGATEVIMSGIIGQPTTLTLEHLGRMRRSTLVFRLATHLLSHTLRDAGDRPKLHLFPQAQAIVGAWLDSGLLVCKGGTFPAQLAYRQLSDEVCDLLVGAIDTGAAGSGIVRATLDPYDPEGTTASVNFTTSKTDRWQPRPDRSQIWAARQPAVEAARETLNAALAGHPTPFKLTTGGRAGQSLDFRATGEVTLPSGEPAPAGGCMEWEVPREAPADWPEAARAPLAAFWAARIARQKEIDASIAARAEFEYLYDNPYEDRKRIRVAGPFTVESLSPHRAAAVGANGELIDELDASRGLRSREAEAESYVEAILENLRSAGVHQKDKGDRIAFTSLKPWPGDFIAAEGRYSEGEAERRAAILIGPEYGTVQRADLAAAAREPAEAGFDLVIACAFNFDAHASEPKHIGRVPVLQARMNPDLHMAGDLKAGGGNLFTVFGEPDIEILREPGQGGDTLRVALKGVDIFKPSLGEVTSSEAEDIACWFIDTDYDEESFFVRHAYFPAADIPYKAIRTTLKAEIDEDAWESLRATVSRPFPKPKSGRIAVKVINHLGDEVMKVFTA